MTATGALTLCRELRKPVPSPAARLSWLPALGAQRIPQRRGRVARVGRSQPPRSGAGYAPRSSNATAVSATSVTPAVLTPLTTSSLSPTVAAITGATSRRSTIACRRTVTVQRRRAIDSSGASAKHYGHALLRAGHTSARAAHARRAHFRTALTSSLWRYRVAPGHPGRPPLRGTAIDRSVLRREVCMRTLQFFQPTLNGTRHEPGLAPPSRVPLRIRCVRQNLVCTGSGDRVSPSRSTPFDVDRAS